MGSRVLIVDDSRVFRGIVQGILEKIPGITVVGSVWNGEKALDFLQKNEVDIVTLDVEMPGMNGLETLRKIVEFQQSGQIKNGLGVIMLSSVTERGADTTIAALDSGAFDFILKPDVTQADPERYLTTELREKIHALGENRTGRKLHDTYRKPLATGTVIHNNLVNTRDIQLIAIGVSTGGPKALVTMLPDLCSKVTCPIVIVQHMPPKFTESLAQSLDRICSHKVVEASDNQRIESRTVFIAPGGKHLVVHSKGGSLFTGINEQPPESGCRPSVDVLFRSVANACGGNSIAVILTGMGSDGTAGIRPLKRAGASIIVQDELTSVVWGMPGSAVATGLVDRVVPLMNIPTEIVTLMKGKA